MMVLKLLGQYLWQPVFLLGVVVICVLYQHRMRKERHFFRIAANRDFYEMRHFIKHGLIFSIIGSTVTLALGIVFPLQTIVIYEILGCFFLLVGIRSNQGLNIVLLTGLITWTASMWYPENGKIWLFRMHGDFLGTAILVLCSLYLLFKIILLKSKNSAWFSPRIKDGKRGRRIAYYIWRELTIVPLVILIPGDVIASKVGFWPILNIGDKHFTFFILPFVVSAFMKIFKQAPQDAIKLYRKQTWHMLEIAIIGCIVSYFVPMISGAIFVLLFIVWLVQGQIRKNVDKKSDRWYVETNQGVRVVAIQPNTPAAKMNLVPGDIILECNQQSVTNEEELYEALQKNSAYCNFRIRTFKGDFKVAESAIYAGAPHEIGLILFH